MAEPIYIPIGTDCSIADQLRKKGIRTEAYPFDWNVTPVSSALALLKENFAGFMDPKNLIFLPQSPRQLFDDHGQDLTVSQELVTPVVCRRYRMLFAHDFSAAGMADLSKIQSVYQRRIQRLQDVMMSPSPKILIYRLGLLKPWQEDQFRQAGIQFTTDDEKDIKDTFQSLNLKNTQLVSYDDFRARGSLRKQASLALRRLLGFAGSK